MLEEDRAAFLALPEQGFEACRRQSTTVSSLSLVRLAQEDPKTFVPLLIKTMPPEPRIPQEGGLNIHIDLT